MLTISGYQIAEEIHAGAHTVVYRGIRESECQQVIIKILKNEFPTIEEIAKLKQEYKISQSLDVEGIVKPLELINSHNRLALILEDFGGVSLKQYIISQKIKLIDFLNFAIQITTALGYLHQNQIIHKDIKPSNIIINPETRQVKITDFSIASRLEVENQSAIAPNSLEGTLAYMSPEQTGRMNRCIDYRTDFYSLGVTFYELLTGELPFNAIDPMEWVHCHIAKHPLPFTKAEGEEKIGEIPEAVSDIVMKLLAKTAEDRYQSAAGLKIDLETCLFQLQTKGQISNFAIGQRDISGKFIIPQKLYGRTPEVATLLEAFERVSGSCDASQTGHHPYNGGHERSEMMLISGYSGIGKSALVNEIYKPIVRQRGYFIAGKFDQFKRNIPYASLIQAFQSLMLQLLTENAESLKIWQAKLLDALGKNGKVIIDVIPEVELIIGEQPSVPPLGPNESQNRFNLVFKKFIHVFCQKEHPLVIFLDDLQWADSASLKLIHLLMTDRDSKYLLLIGAYRDNEVSPIHPLIQTLEEIQKSGAVVNAIALKPLDIGDVSQLVADTLGGNLTPQPPSLQGKGEKSELLPSPCRGGVGGEVNLLSELVFHETHGNPFFLTQLLKSLYQEKLLVYDLVTSKWQWDIEKIQAIALTEGNVVELLARNIQKLPFYTQQVIKLAACIGNQFNLDVLAIVNERSQSETAADLWEALQTGLILPLSDAYKIPLVMGNERSTQLPNTNYQIPITQISYKFLHDRVQQAAYSLIPEDEKQTTHHKIGQLLLKSIRPEEREENIFEIVNQLNFSRELLALQSERYELAELNLIAGKKAKASNAPVAAVRYLNVGLELLAADSWQSHYELTLALYESTVAAEYLNTNFERANQLSDVVLSHAKTLLEKISVYETQIQFYIAQNQMVEAIDIALPVLKMLGIALPKNPGKLNILVGLLYTKIILTGKRIEDLAELPEMTDPYKLAALRLLNTVFESAYLTSPKMIPLIIFKMVNLCLKSGNSPLAAFPYVVYGFLLCAILGDINSGYRFGKLSLKVLDKFNAREFQSKVNVPFNSTLRHWKEPAKETIEAWLEGIQIGLEVGDILNVGNNALVYCHFIFFIGESLEFIAQKQAQYLDLMLKLKQESSIYSIKIFRQMTMNLLGQSEDRCKLVGESFTEETMLQSIKKSNNFFVLCVLYIAKSILCYLFKQYQESVNNANSTEKYAESILGLMHTAVHNFYYSLALLACYPLTSKKEEKEYMKKVASNQKKIKKWAFYAPSNYQHKYDLVEAEKARVLGQDVKAAQYYDASIKGAREQGYIQEEAIANERAAEFYLARGREKIAKVYLTDAYYGYIRWGAMAKVKDLEEQYPQLLQRNPAPQNVSDERTATTNTTSTSSSILYGLDYTTVIKASQALSGEIFLSQLLDKLMKIAIENAGAQTGFLILERSGQLVIEAAGAVDRDVNISMHEKEPNPPAPFPTREGGEEVVNGDRLPLSILNYVQKTQQNVVLHEATTDELFAADPYIIANKPKSILCAPLLSQRKLIGIVYLENNLTTGAFTRDRLEILTLLTSQAAISIKNAVLYANLATANEQLEDYSRTLEVKVEQRTQELKANNVRLQQEITDRLQAEAILQESQRFIEKIAHTTPNLLYIFDFVEKRNIYSNRQIGETLGYTPEEIYKMGANFFATILHPDDLERAIAHQNTIATAEENRIFEIEYRVRRKSGEWRWLRSRETQFAINPDGSLLQILGTAEDITDRKLVEEALHYQQEQSERLLLNILPGPIADRLKQGRGAIAEHFDEVTVLFADIVGFTQLSTRISATELVNLLNQIFSTFDELADRHGVEKIKTIGDAYMVVGGLPLPRKDHAEAIAEMAIDMQQEIARFSIKHGEALNIRIGINSGSVVAGVIGLKKFIYDLWGDTVNTASRMESHGIPGAIQVTAQTYELLRDKYIFEERGVIHIKGKGEMMTYLLTSRQ